MHLLVHVLQILTHKKSKTSAPDFLLRKLQYKLMKNLDQAPPIPPKLVFISVCTTRGQGIIRVVDVVVVFCFILLTHKGSHREVYQVYLSQATLEHSPIQVLTELNVA